MHSNPWGIGINSLLEDEDKKESRIESWIGQFLFSPRMFQSEKGL